MPTYVLLTVLASLLFGSSAALMKHGMAANLPQISISAFIKEIGRVVRTLLASRQWLAGALLGLVGGVVIVQAQSMGDLSVVLPLANLTCAFAVLFGTLLLGERLVIWEWVGIGVLVLGAILVGISAPAVTGGGTDMGRLWLFTGFFGLVTVLSLINAQISRSLSSEISLSLAAGLCFGLGYVYLKVMTNMVQARLGAFNILSGRSLVAALTIWPIWVWAVTNAAAFVFMQTAFSHGRVSIVNPLVTVIANMLPALAGAVVFGENLSVVRVVGIVVVAVGALLLTFSSKAVEQGTCGCRRP